MMNHMYVDHLRTDKLLFFFVVRACRSFISSTVKDLMSMSTSPKALTKGCFDRHPYAEMLVTGSFDKTVKFWS